MQRIGTGPRAVLADQLTGVFVEGDQLGERGAGIFVWDQSTPLEVATKTVSPWTMADELVALRKNTELITHVVHPNYVGVRFFIELVLHTLGPDVGGLVLVRAGVAIGQALGVRQTTSQRLVTT